MEATARLFGARCYVEQVQGVSEQRELLFRGKFDVPCGDLQCELVLERIPSSSTNPNSPSLPETAVWQGLAEVF